MKDGFVKVAAAAPVIRVADAEYNADRVIECMRKAEAQGVKVLVFPELTLTGCTCFDLFRHKVLLDGAEESVRVRSGITGTPLQADYIACCIRTHSKIMLACKCSGVKIIFCHAGDRKK